MIYYRDISNKKHTYLGTVEMNEVTMERKCMDGSINIKAIKILC